VSFLGVHASCFLRPDKDKTRSAKSQRKTTKGEKHLTDQERKIAKHAKAKREEEERRRKGESTRG
jgi:hypothetical protein